MLHDLELSSLEGKGAAPCAVGIPDLYSLTSMFMVLAHFWQLRPSFLWHSLDPDENRSILPGLMLPMRSVYEILSDLVFTFIIVLRICNTVFRLNIMFLFFLSSTFKKMKSFTLVCCSMWSILSREFYSSTSNESFWMELIRSSSNQRSTIWSSRTSER